MRPRISILGHVRRLVGPMVGRFNGRSVGQSVGRSVGRMDGWSDGPSVRNPFFLNAENERFSS